MNKKKRPAPRSSFNEWVAYYKSVKNNELKDSFFGCFPDGKRKSEDYWAPIRAHQYVYKNRNLDEDDIRELHPWFIDTRENWEYDLSNKWSKNTTSPFFNTASDIKEGEDYLSRYKKIMGKDLIDNNIKNRPSLTPHHLISDSVARAVHSHWKKIINEKIGYNINCAENLVVLPNIADISCYLSVPLHQGAHGENEIGIPELDMKDIRDKTTATFDNVTEKLWASDTNAKGYHSKVMKLLTPVLKKYFDDCKNIDDVKFIKDMNRLSKNIVKRLNDFSIVINKHGSDYEQHKEHGCQNKRGTSGLTKRNSLISEAKKGDDKEACKLKRDHDYLEELFYVKEINRKKRRKNGFVVSSEIKFGS